MKKLIAFLIIISTLIVVSFSTVMAASPETTEGNADVEISLEGEDTITEGTESFIVNLKLGKFTNVEENTVMGLEATLDYSEDLFESVIVTQQNGWKVTYNVDSKKIIGTVDESAEDTVIAQLEFVVKEGLEIGTTGKVSLLDLNISDDSNLDKTVEELSKDNITLIEAPVEISPSSSPGSNLSSDGEEETKTPTKTTDSTKKDNTVTSMILPKAGMTVLIIGAIVLVSLIGIGVYVRFKTIKIK